MNWFVDVRQVKREKRALVNIVGTALRSLFGVLSEEDAEFFMSKIQELEATNSEQIRIMESQTSIIQSAINQINETNAVQNNIVENIVKVGNIAFEVKQKTNLLYLIQSIFMSLYSFQSKQRLLIEAISVGQNNPNNPLLLAPRIFFNELQKIHSLISARNLDLPIGLSPDSLSMFYHISTAEATIFEGQLIICFKMPLVHTKYYDLFKMTSLPYRVKETIFSYVIPTHEFLAIDRLKNKVIPITNDELQNCLQTSNNQLICKRTFPILYAGHTNLCEVILLRENIISDVCNVRVTNLTQEAWIRMKQINTFLYILPYPTTVIISCREEEEGKSLKLNGTGTIQIKPGCEIKTHLLIMTGFEIITTTNYRKIDSVFANNPVLISLMNDTIPIESLDIPMVKSPGIINNNEVSELERMSQSLKDLRLQQFQLKHRTSSEYIKSDISNIFIIICILTLSIVFIKIRYAMKKVKKIRALRESRKPINISAPTPSPRQSIDPIQRIYPHIQGNMIRFENHPPANIQINPIRNEQCINQIVNEQINQILNEPCIDLIRNEQCNNPSRSEPSRIPISMPQNNIEPAQENCSTN